MNSKEPETKPKSDDGARFSNLVVSLQLTALYHLGEAPGPAGEKPSVDISLAKENLEMLEMLETKTRGNLSSGEDQLIKHALTNLRLHFVGKTK
tara:strand:+ start:497 stop:778 length:282 start_codon:yes stop_codon:yes gene_type:complete